MPTDSSILLGTLCFHGFAPHQGQKLSMHGIQPMKPAAGTPNTTPIQQDIACRPHSTEHTVHNTRHNTKTMLTSLLDGCLMCSASSPPSPLHQSRPPPPPLPPAVSPFSPPTAATARTVTVLAIPRRARQILLLLPDKCTVLPLPDKNYTISGETLYRKARLSIFHLIIPPITGSLVSRLLYHSTTPSRVNCFAN
jgi:hypothetical protein